MQPCVGCALRARADRRYSNVLPVGCNLANGVWGSGLSGLLGGDSGCPDAAGPTMGRDTRGMPMSGHVSVDYVGKRVR